MFNNEVPATSSTNRVISKSNSILDDYDIPGETLGVGVSGKVKLCIKKKTKQRCALKILGDNPRARREIQLHYRCSFSPHVVSIIDIYENTNCGKRCLLLVLECMDGGELFSRIEQKTNFTEREAAFIMRNITSAVQHLHKLDVVHRDLKPENLLYVSNEADSLIKLTDFGFAKDISLGLKTPCYTPYYVAPEILNNEDVKNSVMYDKACDVWSLGIILYILLSGYPPFVPEGGGHISPGMKKRIRTGAFEFLKEDWQHVSQSVKDLIVNLLSPDAQKRMSVDEIMRHPWIQKPEDVPSTPLQTSFNVRLDFNNIKTVQNEMEQVLAQMRSETDGEKSQQQQSLMNNSNLHHASDSSSSSVGEMVLPLHTSGSQLWSRRNKS